jgi:hypothetical protein
MPIRLAYHYKKSSQTIYLEQRQSHEFKKRYKESIHYIKLIRKFD